MSLPTDSEQRWQEDFEREMRFGRCLQAIRAAICRSYEQAQAEARKSIKRALGQWDGGDRIAAHLEAAREEFLDGEECRRHLREAAQLLMPYVDEPIEFERGGAFA